jgi:hypothetical protein
MAKPKKIIVTVRKIKQSVDAVIHKSDIEWYEVEYDLENPQAQALLMHCMNGFYYGTFVPTQVDSTNLTKLAVLLEAHGAMLAIKEDN